MAGKIQRNVEIVGELEVLDTDEAIALALAMCPVGEAIEIHAASCSITTCTCTPRVIVKQEQAPS